MNLRTPSDRGERKVLYWAVCLSVLIHLLLVLFSDWFPFGPNSAVAAEPADEITFTFSDDVEPTTDDPREDAPFLPVEERSVAEPPPDPIPAEIPSPTLPPVPALEPVEEPQLEEPTLEEPELPEPDRPAEPPPADQGRLREHENESTDATAEPRRLDVKQALRDFQKTVKVRPPPSPAQSGGSPTPRNVIMPDLSEIPFAGFGMGNLVFESRDYNWEDYGRQIYWAIWKAWHQRLWLTTDEFEKWAHTNASWYLDDDQTQVRFVIERNGQVSGIAQEAASRCGPLDDSALTALSEVVLPPLPADFPRDREVVHGRFLAKGPIRALRPTLRRLRAAGYF